MKDIPDNQLFLKAKVHIHHLRLKSNRKYIPYIGPDFHYKSSNCYFDTIFERITVY